MFFVVAVPTVLLAGVSKGGFGGGADFLATLLLALVLEPAVALGMMLPLLMLVDVTILRPYWLRWDWAVAKGVILGAVPGVGLGIVFWRVADPDAVRLVIGLIALAFVAFSLGRSFGWIDPRPRDPGLPAALVAGLGAGFASFISHAGGPPVAVYLLAKGVSKTAFQATIVIVFWAINIMKAVPYAFLGIFTRDTLMAGAMLAPVILLGAAIGVRAHARVSDRFFFRLTLVLLTLAGLKLVRDALA